MITGNKILSNVNNCNRPYSVSQWVSEVKNRKKLDYMLGFICNELLKSQLWQKTFLKFIFLNFYHSFCYCFIWDTNYSNSLCIITGVSSKVTFSFYFFFSMKSILRYCNIPIMNHIIKMVRLRACSYGRAGRAMGNGSFERSWTPHNHTMWPFFIFALPALPGVKIALPPL